jgi:hypothetical protein
MANEAAEISHMCLTILRWSLVLSNAVLLEADFMVFKTDSANKESSKIFYKVLNDDVLIDNMKLIYLRI